jgi:hypothetical protein
MSQTAEGKHMDVLNSGTLKGCRQLILVELRVVPRARDGPYIHQLPDAVSLEKDDKVIQGPCRVAHRPKRDAAAVSFDLSLIWPWLTFVRPSRSDLMQCSAACIPRRLMDSDGSASSHAPPVQFLSSIIRHRHCFSQHFVERDCRFQEPSEN